MELFVRLLLDMSRWSRKRPSKYLVIGVCVTLALVAVVVGIERIFGWPEALSVDPLPSNPMLAR